MSDKLLLVKFDLDLYYSHAIGVFTITADKLQLILEENPSVYLGEISGKHSEIEERIARNLLVLSDDIEYIKDFQAKCGLPESEIGQEGKVFGIDPISHLEESGFFDD